MEPNTDSLNFNQDQKSLWSNALKAGFYEFQGFVAHDKHEYKNAVENFHESFLLTLPWYNNAKLRLLDVAKEKTEVLRYHDEIEESEGTKKEKLEDVRWETKVLEHAKLEAKHLGLNLGYATNKTNFYRLHGQGEKGFRRHVYDMDKYFTENVTGDSHLHLITAPLYLACVAFHDMRRILKKTEHDEFSKKMMQMHYADYVFQIHNTIDYKAKVLGKLNPIDV